VYNHIDWLEITHFVQLPSCKDIEQTI